MVRCILLTRIFYIVIADSALEAALERHASHSVLEKTYNPTLLARAPRIESDIAYLLDIPENDWKSHPLHLTFQGAFPAGLAAYLSRIQAVSNGPRPERLLGHSYVRYLGDLSGGQEIRRQVAKAYGFESGQGTSFYSFSRLGEPGKEASVGDMARIKEWFRNGIDEGAGEDQFIKRMKDSTFHMNIPIADCDFRGNCRRSRPSIPTQHGPLLRASITIECG